MGDGNVEAAPAAPNALVVSTYPDVYGGSSPGAQDLVGVNALNTAPSLDVYIHDYLATHHDGTIGSTAPVAPGPGVASGTSGAAAEPLWDTSSTVLINGSPCVRNGACHSMNNGNTTGLMTYQGSGPIERKVIYGTSNPPLDLTEIERYLADPDGFDMSQAPWPGLDITLEPMADYQARVAAAEASQRSQVGGFFRGVGGQLWDTVKDTFEFAANTSQYTTDTLLSPIGVVVDWATDNHPPEWLPSAARGQATSQAIADTAVAVAQNPGLLWDALTEDVRVLWAQGEYGEAIGRSSVMALELFVGTKGLGRARNLSNMSPDAVRALERRGVIDAEDVAEAEALRHADEAADASRRGEDGVTIDGPRVLEGSFFRVVRDGDEAVKTLKSEVGPQGDRRALTPDQQVTTVDHTLGFTEDVRGALGDVVPEFTRAGPTQLRTEWVEGTPLAEMPIAQRLPLLEQREKLLGDAAEAIFGDRDYYSTGTLADGFTIQVDDNIANFLVDGAGNLRWIDPIAVWPPK